MTHARLASLTLAAALAATAVPAAPALADGAASTRNIILGGAAAAAATLMIINHNKQVHAKYAAYDAQVAASRAREQNAEAAYEAEHSAYVHQSAEVAALEHEVAVQHRVVVGLEHRLAERGGAPHRYVAAARVGPARTAAAPAARPPAGAIGWGSL